MEGEGREIDRGGEWGCGSSSVGTVFRPHPPGGWIGPVGPDGCSSNALEHWFSGRSIAPSVPGHHAIPPGTIVACLGTPPPPSCPPPPVSSNLLLICGFACWLPSSGPRPPPVTQSGEHDMPGHHGHRPSPPSQPPSPQEAMTSCPCRILFWVPPFLTSGSKMGVFNSRPS